jgi:ketosteroid isomerase-like protein
MTPNEQAVRTYVALFNKGDMTAIKSVFTEDAVVQGVLGQAPLDWALGVWQELHDGLSCHLEIAAIAVTGDQVGVRYRETGRFVGAFRGLAGIAPTGKTYDVTAMEWFECRDGKIACRWGARDFETIKRQILG